MSERKNNFRCPKCGGILYPEDELYMEFVGACSYCVESALTSDRIALKKKFEQKIAELKRVPLRIKEL